MVFNLWEFSCKIYEENPQEIPQRLPKKKIKIELKNACLKARFHYERGKEHCLFVLLIFFCARFNFNRSLQSKINKRNKECSFPRS